MYTGFPTGNFSMMVVIISFFSRTSTERPRQRASTATASPVGPQPRTMTSQTLLSPITSGAFGCSSAMAGHRIHQYLKVSHGGRGYRSAAPPDDIRVVSEECRVSSITRPVIFAATESEDCLRLWRRGWCHTLCRLRRGSALRFLGDIRRGHEPIEELVEVLVECLVVDLDAGAVLVSVEHVGGREVLVDDSQGELRIRDDSGRSLAQRSDLLELQDALVHGHSLLQIPYRSQVVREADLRHQHPAVEEGAVELVPCAADVDLQEALRAKCPRIRVHVVWGDDILQAEPR